MSSSYKNYFSAFQRIWKIIIKIPIKVQTRLFCTFYYKSNKLMSSLEPTKEHTRALRALFRFFPRCIIRERKGFDPGIVRHNLLSANKTGLQCKTCANTRLWIKRPGAVVGIRRLTMSFFRIEMSSQTASIISGFARKATRIRLSRTYPLTSGTARLCNASDLNFSSRSRCSFSYECLTTFSFTVQFYF